ncbi:hypothetical protein AB0M39_00815 [Streptomyces sp. NPDC051907]|uniref:hypothetical protein n=1 Tax=Streptomyces sp. NPDC051907 TaxID=3155284 RepID=UPI0034182A24
MKDRSLKALGLDGVPAMQPLTYPGLPATEPCLLAGDRLLPLEVRPLRLGDWRLTGESPRQSLDEALAGLGQTLTGRRFPVVAVGSNASPGQLGHKLARLGVPAAVPMVPVRVRGVGVGCSGHIGAAGYVASAPYLERAASEVLVVSWFDAAQVRAVDDTEFHYRRVLLPGDAFEMTMPSGERLGGAYLYVSSHGVLAGPDGGPRRSRGDQSELLASLLAASPRLRELLGPDPASWVDRARAEREVREAGGRVFAEEGWALEQPGFLPYLDAAVEQPLYDDLPPLGGSLGSRP